MLAEKGNDFGGMRVFSYVTENSQSFYCSTCVQNAYLSDLDVMLCLDKWLAGASELPYGHPDQTQLPVPSTWSTNTQISPNSKQEKVMQLGPMLQSSAGPWFLSS